ncbi:MAG: glycosyltransferase family 4 protein [Nitrospinales bacterium]
MNILHFINIPLSADQLASGGAGINHSGGWLATLIRNLEAATNHTFTCVAIGKTRNTKESIKDRIRSIVIPERNGLAICRDIVEKHKPDLVHIHGTERRYGLLSARGLIKNPVVISLQGLLGPCSKWQNFFGNASFSDIIQMHRWLDFVAKRGLWQSYLKIRNNAKREHEIISGNRFFIGRTEWDSAYIHSVNPNACYYHGGELLRNEFWRKRWDIGKAQEHRIILTNASHPRKGTELLLDAVRILKPEYPGIQVCIAGAISRRSGYGRYMLKRIWDIKDTVIELGQLNAEEMSNAMVTSHLFVSPSFIENSSNAVCEAQLIGMPVIAAYTGGLPSIVENNQTGLFFQKGDAFMLARKIRQVFKSNELAVKLGENAQRAARRRHHPDLVVEDILSAYKSVLK